MQAENPAASRIWHQSVKARTEGWQESALHDRGEERGWDAGSNRVFDDLYLHLFLNRVIRSFCKNAGVCVRHQGRPVNLSIHLFEK
eukprot:1926553-Rhodomonas_salina.1